jgi:hypothetical protein
MSRRVVLTLAIGSLVTFAAVIGMSFRGVEWQMLQPNDEGVIENKDGDLYSIGLQGGAAFWTRSEMREVPLNAFVSMINSSPEEPHWLVPTHGWQGSVAYHSGPSRMPLRVHGVAIWHVPIWPELALLSLLSAYIIWRTYRAPRNSSARCRRPGPVRRSGSTNSSLSTLAQRRIPTRRDDPASIGARAQPIA